MKKENVNMISFPPYSRKPKGSTPASVSFDRISIVLRSKETGESGMGECFVERTR